MSVDWNGYPPNPQVSGWHMLKQGYETAAFWNATKQFWEQGGICCGGSCYPKFLTDGNFEGGVQYLYAIPPASRLAALETVAERTQKFVRAVKSSNHWPVIADSIDGLVTALSALEKTNAT